MSYVENFLANVARGEHDLDIGTSLPHYLCEFGAAHARHPDVHKKQADLGLALKQRQSVVPVVGVEHCEAEIDEHVDSSTDAFAITNSRRGPSARRCPYPRLAPEPGSRKSPWCRLPGPQQT